MEEKESNSENQKSFEKITVYLPVGLKEDMDNYVKTKHYGNRSAMIRKAYQILNYIFPLDSTQQNDFNFQEKINNIEQQLRELNLKLELAKKEDDEVDLEMSDFQDPELDLTDISSEVLQVIKEKFNGRVKDFTIIDYFKSSYSRGIIFHVLQRLEEKNKLSYKKGEWRINE